jgi:hypothetical protein
MAGNSVRFSAYMDDHVSSVIDQLEAKFKKAGTTFGKHFGGGSEMAKGIGLAAGVAGFNLLGSAAGAAGEFIGESIGAASALNESLSKSNVVFGDSAKDIEQWANTSAKAFGQSKQQALEAAGTYGNLFQAFGVGQKESADMSKSLVQLAADLASFNNTSVDDALLALRSGLSGETEPLKRYGIAISDARMRTELASQGVKDLGATLTPLQKTTAAYALIMRDSALAQGDFGRTSDGLANSQRILNAELDDLAATIGTALIPPMTELVKYGAEGAQVLADMAKNAGPLATVADLAGKGIHTIIAPAELAAHAIGDLGSSSQNAVDDTRESAKLMGVAARSLAAPIPREIRQASIVAHRITKQLPGELAFDLKSGYDAISSASTALGEAMKNPIKQAAREKALNDILAGKGSVGRKLAAGLRSADPVVRQAAEALRASIYSELSGLQDFKVHISATSSFKGGYKGGARAAGGPVSAGQPYLVGEKGPELFTPNASGNITPNSGLRGRGLALGGGLTIHMNFTWPPTPAQARQIAATVYDELAGYDRGNPTFAPA